MAVEMKMETTSSLTVQATDNSHRLSLKLAFSERMNTYFSQQDQHDRPSQIEYTATKHSEDDEEDDRQNKQAQSTTRKRPQYPYKYEYHYTVAYWRAIAQLFGDYFFIFGSVVQIIHIYDNTSTFTEIDIYALSAFTFWMALVGYTIGGCITLTQILHEHHAESCKLVSFYASITFVAGQIVSTVKLFLPVIHVPYSSIYIFSVLSAFSGLCFCIGGILLLFPNKGWLWRPWKLAWWIGWTRTLGGFCYLLWGFSSLLLGTHPDETQFNHMYLWFGLVAACCYLIGHILGLFMWKLEQFGHAFLPHLNTDKSTRERQKHYVLYRDLLFLQVYIWATMVTLIGLVYGSLCEHFSGSMKNLALVLTASLVVLFMDSFIHSEPKQRPLTYLLWYLRCLFVWLLINMTIDTYHVSGANCKNYACPSTDP